MSNKVYLLKTEVERPSNMYNSQISFGSITFTRAQILVLEKIGEGLPNQDIAADLGISRRTIESHISNIKIILANHFGYKFCDRELVIFSRKMLDDYRDFIRTNIEDFTDRYLVKHFVDDFGDNTELVDFELERLKSQSDMMTSIQKPRMNPSLDKWTNVRNGF